MDKLSIAGLLLAILAVIGGFVIEGGALITLFHFPAFLIVFGGTIGAVMLQSPASQFQRGLLMSKWVFATPVYDVDEGIERISHWANEARQNGFLALENEAIAESDTFINKGLNLLVDGAESEVIRDALDIELTLEREHLLKSARIFDSMGGYSPTIGIIGAVLGLIQAMANIKDPTSLGNGIATAFVATIYGVGFANLLFIPVAEKLKAVVYQQMLYKEMLIEGILSIANGENPRSIELKLSSYRK
ncbi:flagellar motor protein [Flocculibacter collagenilyticus]|uniref:flagellar motor protein n=1 Tax=Flocculibacter collagenilyticus TaxID=2744479 RepID=UPI0018F2F0E0|nr:flagellar motor protein [Flocculibacter collagenilyticus]